MQHCVSPKWRKATGEKGTLLLDALRLAGYHVDAPCGGNGTCGKCKVQVDGVWVQACRYRVEKDITLFYPENIAQIRYSEEAFSLCAAAFDIGTTTVVCQLMTPKGAIAAGIEMMMDFLEIGLQDIDSCLLAGAFGSYLNPESACRMGLLPEELLGRITAVGNLALEGARLLALGAEDGENIVHKAEYLELGSLAAFPKSFARNMGFREEKWLVKARKCGFTQAVPLKMDSLRPMEIVRQACGADKCGAYGRNWTCPPFCGSLEECRETLQSYKQGILLQTVGKLDKDIDTKGYARIEKAHLAAFHSFAEEIRKVYPDALCLGAGGCRICGKCAWPEPCRFPEKACSSMEAYGLFVTQVCKENGLNYYYGKRSIAYCACVLFDH